MARALKIGPARALAQKYLKLHRRARQRLSVFTQAAPDAGYPMLYIDMDGVLVRQTARSGFDRMPWTDDGQELWRFAAQYSPALLTQVRPDPVLVREKLEWVRRELGPGVVMIATPDSWGKSPYAFAGAILVDDGIKHRADWMKHGGIFIHHKTAAATIDQLKVLL